MLAQAMQHYVDEMGLAGQTGCLRSNLPGVSFFRQEASSHRQPFLYQSGIIIIGQGRKTIHLGDTSVDYGEGDYLVLGVPLPLECEALALNGKPILGLTIDVQPKTLHHLVNQLHETSQFEPQQQPTRGLESVKMPSTLEDACRRLLQVLVDPMEATILGPAIVHEIIFRVLTGSRGNTLMGLVHHDAHYARIAKTLNRIHVQFADPITVEQLADDANMSVATFHRAFRQVTLESPLQYLKKVRLVKARDYITLDGRKANEAAFMVGYTSTSQFSREFKRHFNCSPGSLAG